MQYFFIIFTFFFSYSIAAAMQMNQIKKYDDETITVHHQNDICYSSAPPTIDLICLDEERPPQYYNNFYNPHNSCIEE